MLRRNKKIFSLKGNERQDTSFVIYCRRQTTKAALKLSALEFSVKEIIGGIHYWEYFERYPINHRMTEV